MPGLFYAIIWLTAPEREATNHEKDWIPTITISLFRRFDDDLHRGDGYIAGSGI